MAGVSVKQIYQGSGGERNATERNYVYVYRVVMSSGLDTQSAVASYLFAQTAVREGAVLSEDADAYCQGIRFQRVKPAVWIATATFSTARERVEVPAGSTQDPVDVEWDTEETERAVVKDRDNKAVLNSAGDPFNPPYVTDDSFWVASISTTVSSVPSYLGSYRNAINSDACTVDGWTLAAKQAKVRRIHLGKKTPRNSGTVRELTLQVAVKDDGEIWDEDVLDAGFRRLEVVGAGSFVVGEEYKIKTVGTTDFTAIGAASNTVGVVFTATGVGSGSGDAYENGKRVEIVNDDNSKPVEPVLLDGAGGVVAAPTPDNAAYITVKASKLQTFAGNLPGFS